MGVNLHIAAITNRTRGWVSVSADSPAWPAGRTRLRMLHWGHKKPYLGADGWQVAEAWCDLEDAFIEDGRSNLLLPPRLTRWLDTGSNYELTVEVAGSQVLQQPIPWRISCGRAAPAAPTLLPEEIATVLGAVGSRSLEPEPVLASGEESEETWTQACLVDSPTSYEPFLIEGGPFVEQARYELAHFLPQRVTVRFGYGGSIPAHVRPKMNLSAFLLDAADRTRADRDFVSGFAAESATNLPLNRSACGGVIHRVPIQNDQGAVVETVDVDFTLLPADVCALAFTVSLFPGTEHPESLLLEAGELRVVETISGLPLLAVDIPRLPGVAGAYVAQLVRREGAWRLKERTDTFVFGLDEICARFAVAVAEGA